MKTTDEAELTAILARLAVSREELRRVLEPPRREADDPSDPAPRGDEFPRSRTMQMLMSGRGLGIIGTVAAGLFVARPTLVLRLLRMVPASAVGKMLLIKAMEAFKSQRESRGAP